MIYPNKESAMHMRKRNRIVVLVLVLTGICFTAGEAEEATGDNIPHTKNGSAPKSGTLIWNLEELWRTGGEDSDVFFGQILRVRDDTYGNIYVLDAQQNHIEVFSPEGEHLSTLSREGEGPGEIRQPGDFFILPDGTVCILTLFPGKLTKLTPTGEPLGSVQIGVKKPTAGGFIAAFRAANYDTTIVCGGAQTDMTGGMQHRIWFASRIDDRGAELARCYARRAVLDFSNPVIVEKDLIDWGAVNAKPGPNGRIYIAPEWDEYRIEVYKPDGNLELVIEREFETRTRTDRERNIMISVFEAWERDSPFDVDFDIEENPPAIREMFIDRDGFLWVENNRSRSNQSDGIFLTYDIFSATGSFDRRVAIRCDADPDSDELYLLDGDRAVVVTGGIDAFFGAMAGGAMRDDVESDAENLELICYRVNRTDD